jgi:acyl carrier protein
MCAEFECAGEQIKNRNARKRRRGVKEEMMDEDMKKLTAIIADVLNVDPNEITTDTTFTDDLGADSLDLYQILMGIEEEYGISVPQEQAESITNVAEALELIKKAVGEND